jgi:hypothetical protein
MSLLRRVFPNSFWEMIDSLAKERICLFLGSLPRAGPTNMDRTNANTVAGFDWFLLLCLRNCTIQQSHTFVFWSFVRQP